MLHQPDTGHGFRPLRRRGSDWTLKEHEVVVTHWPDVRTIKRLLPHRTQRAIEGFAGRCNLRKPNHIWTEEQTAHLRKRVREFASVAEIAQELRMNPEQVQNRKQYLRLPSPRRRPPITGHKAMDAIRQRAFDLNMSMSELDEACASGRALQKWTPRRTVCVKVLQKAAKAMDGEISIEWQPLE
jgi:hypothetical protein